jgi:Ran GTPase-activating protein (RanGAP) involved in mRNA processing and transport
MAASHSGAGVCSLRKNLDIAALKGQTVRLADKELGHWTKARLERVLQEKVLNNTELFALAIEGDAYKAMDPGIFENLLRSLASSSPSLLRSLELTGQCSRSGLHKRLQDISTQDAQSLREFVSSSASLQSFSMDKYSVSEAEWRAVIDGIMASELIHAVDFTSCILPPSSAVELLTLHTTRLHRLNLSNTNVKLQASGEELVQLLTNTTSLKHLDLSGATFGREGFEALVCGLRHNTCLEILKLGNSKLGRGLDGQFIDGLDLVPLAQALAHNGSLLHLDLSGNVIVPYEAEAFGHMIACNTRLAHLNLNNTSLGHDVADIAEGLAGNVALRHLDVGSNYLGVDGIKAIADALVQNTTLTTLYMELATNKLYVDSDSDSDEEDEPSTESRDGMKQLFTALAQNATLLHLNVSENELTDGEAQLLASALETNCRLRYLDVAEHAIESEGFCTLCNVIAHNTTLVVLNLGTLFQEKCLSAVCDILTNNTTLQQLEINLQFEPKNWSEFRRALETNSTIQSLRVESCDDRLSLAVARSLNTNVYLNEVSFASYLNKKAIMALGNALRATPRYTCMTLEGVQLSKKATALGLPCRQTGDGWADDEVVAYLHGLHVDKIFAFVCGQHDRLGGASVVRQLSHDCVRLVVLSFFGLSLNYFEGNCRAFEYMDVLGALE